MPEQWTPDDVELATLSDALWIDSVPVVWVRLFSRYDFAIRAILLLAGFSDSPELKMYNSGKM